MGWFVVVVYGGGWCFVGVIKNKISKNGNFIMDIKKYPESPAKGVHLGRKSGGWKQQGESSSDNKRR